MSDGLPGDDYIEQARGRAASEFNDLLAGRIKAEQMPDLIRYCFKNGLNGQFGCYNPHWWIYIEPDYLAYAYEDDEELDSEYGEYYKYTDPEVLIAEHGLLFTYGDDWWFKPANRY